MELTLQPPTRRCTASGRDLKTGERFFGVLVADGPKLARQDFAIDHWPGPPPQAVAYWVGQIPASDVPRRPAFDDELLLQCFRQLDGTDDPAQLNFRFVVTLLLLRRKRLRIEDEIVDAGGSIMIVCDTKSNDRSQVRNPRLTAEDLRAAQDEVFRLLGWD